MPRLDLATAPHRLPIHEWLGLNQDTHNVISNWSPRPDGLRPRAFVRCIQRAPLPQRFNGGRGKGKAKRWDQDEGPSTQKGKKYKKDHHRPANSALVATTDHMGKQPQQDLPGHFNELIKSPCTNHAYPVKHLYKDCKLLERLL
jgi:hypothetical protein